MIIERRRPRDTGAARRRFEEEQEDDAGSPDLAHGHAFFRRSDRNRCRSRNQLRGSMLKRQRHPPTRELPMKVTFLAAIALLMASAAVAADKPSQAFLK